MKYNKKELERSKQAYKTAGELWWALNGKNKKTMDDVEYLTWTGLALIAFFAFCLCGYGSMNNFEQFMFALSAAGLVLSPALLFSAIRHGWRAFLKNIMNNKKEQGKLYEQYEYEIQRLCGVYSKSINKIIAMANSNEANITETAKQMNRQFEKELQQIDASPQQIAEVEKLAAKYVKESLSVKDKDSLIKMVNAVLEKQK